MTSIAQGYQEAAWQEGIEQGIQEGTKTRNLEIAKEMLQDKLPKEQISKWTGLSVGQIEALYPL